MRMINDTVMLHIDHPEIIDSVSRTRSTFENKMYKTYFPIMPSYSDIGPKF